MRHPLDSLDIAIGKLRRGEIDRRGFLGLAAALGAVTLLPRTAGASERLVLVNWGGDAIEKFRTVFTEAFTAETGIAVAIDGSGPTEGAIAAMVESRAVKWDVMDAETGSTIALGRRGMLEPIDYGVVDADKIQPGYALEWGAASYFFSYVLAYDGQAFGDNPPKTWADFWDVETFPGYRTLYKWMNGNLEIALLADGVDPAALFPLDVERAFRKLEELKPHILTHWGSGAESQQLFRDGEVVMGQIWNTRAKLLNEDTGGRVRWSFEEAVLFPSSWAVPTGNPGGREAAMRLIAHMQDPAAQVELLREMGNGPANPAAAALVPDDLKAFNCMDPANLAIQHQIDPEWYAEHYGPVLDDYLRRLD